MNLQELHEGLKAIDQILKSKGLQGETSGYVNWIGMDLSINVTPHESYGEGTYWRRSKRFEGTLKEVETILEDATAWAYALPNEEDRAIELLVQKLNEMADKLPKGHGSVAVKAWEEIFNMLKGQAEKIAKRGLPSPESLGDLEDINTIINPDNEIPF